MADADSSCGDLNEKKELEDGEIDDLEEGEINEDLPGHTEYHFNPSEEKSSSANDYETERTRNRQPKSHRANYETPLRNADRQSHYSRRKADRWLRPSFPRTQNIPWDRGGFNNPNGGPRRPFWSDRNNYRLPPVDSEFRLPQAEHSRRSHQNSIKVGRHPPPLMNSNKYQTYQKPHKPPSPKPEVNEDLPEQTDDFEFLLERYKLIQEQLDELDPHQGNFVDELIDDTFVDIPLDNNPVFEQEKENVDNAEFKQDLNDPHLLENPGNFSGVAEEVGGEYVTGKFSPFQINPVTKRVRTLSELNKIDLLARGIEHDRDEGNNAMWLKHEENNESNQQFDEHALIRRKKSRRRPRFRKTKRRRASLASGNHAENKASSSDVYEKLGVAVKMKEPTRPGENNREKKNILKRKQRLKAWQEQQALKQSSKTIDSTKDDYHEKPMDVDSDSTEGVGKIEETCPPLPLVEVPPPPPPSDDSFSHLIPLMEATPYGYYSNYVEQWMNGEALLQNAMGTSQVPQNQLVNNNDVTASRTATMVGEATTKEEVAQEEDDDDASVQALREQLLKSMVTKRAAKGVPPVTEKSMEATNSSFESSRAASPFQDEIARSESPGTMKLGKVSAKMAVTPKPNIPPPKHKPVVIRIGEDSDDSVDSENEGSGMMGLFSGGLDSLIKEARERASKTKSSEETNTSQPTTPDALSALPEEKRSEYKRLKMELANREEQLQKGQTGKAKQRKKHGKIGKQKQQQQQQSQQQQQPQIQSEEKENAAEAGEITKASANIDQSRQELKEQVKNLDEKLMQHKMLMARDQKLLESTKNQLSDSSKALEEHEARVAVLRQQLQRAERLKVVQKDLVNKLQIQNNRLSQRILKREAAARELEERLLRSKALLVAQDARTTTPVNQGKTPPRRDKPTVTNPGVSKSLEEARSKLSELSRTLEESISAKRKEMEVNKAQLRSNNSSNDNAGFSEASDKVPVLKPRKMTEEKLTKEKLTKEKLSKEKMRLKKLEEELSKRLRESTARNSGIPRTIDEKGASSDSELHARKSSSARRMTPPVELADIRSDGKNEELDVVSESSWNILDNSEELEKLKKIQVEKESSGPIFPKLSPNMALPVHLISTQCIWLNINDPSISKQLDTIKGCAAGLTQPQPLVVGNDASVKEEPRRLASGPYRSPLLQFRSYRFSPYYRTKKGLALDSLTYSHLIDPLVPFCSFGLHGICSDPECTRQHFDDVVPNADVILEDLAAYFPPTVNKASGKENIGKTVKVSVETVAKQYEGKVSPAELRVLFVNQLKKKKKLSGVYNIVLDRRPWRPSPYRRTNSGTTPEDESASILTEATFSWKDWKRKLQMEINPRSSDDEECQEIRYFSENYDSIKTLEKATENNPSDENLWIRLAMVHVGSSRTRGDTNNNKDNVDNALNILAHALEANRHSEKLWLKYLELFRSRSTADEIYEVCEEAVSLASSYVVWWTYLDIASGHERKADICLRLLRYLIGTESEPGVRSHRLLEVFLYLVQLDKLRGCHALAVSRFQAALLANAKDWSETLTSVVGHLVCKDLCLFWLCHIHLIEFAYLPSDLFDPATSSPSRVVSKDDFVFPWRAGGGTNHGPAKLLSLFHRALKSCSAAVERRDKITPNLPLYKNLIALERACGKPESAIRSCQRLLKASPKSVEVWFCLAALEQLSGSEETVMNVYKNALQKCNGHAQVAYSAAKYYLEKTNLKECYNTLVDCISQKFVLDNSVPGPRTRAKTQENKTTKPDPVLLYKKILSQSLPLGSEVPPFRTGVDPSKLGGESTYLWLCYCVFFEVFARVRPEERHEMTQGAYETAINSASDRNEVKLLWKEYLHYMVRRLEDKVNTAEEINEIFHRCLVTVPVLTPLPYTTSKSWSNYKFHNEVLMLYCACLGDSLSSTFFDKYLELFPDNSSLAIQAIEYAYKHGKVEKARKISATALLKMPYSINLWKIAIAIELKEQEVNQAKQLYQHATEALPLAATLWKDFALFELSHDKTTDHQTHGINEVVDKAKANDINLEDFLKTLLLK